MIASGALRLTLEGEGVEQLPAVRLALRHATHAGRDFELVLARVTSGVFEAPPAAFDLDGRWHAVLLPGAVETPSVTGSELDWRLTGQLRIPSRHPLAFGQGG